MEFGNCVRSLLAVVFLCLLATCGIVAQTDDSMDIDEVIQILQPAKRAWRTSAYDPEYDWTKAESNRNNDNTLVSFLKRGVPSMSDSYMRPSRLQRIVPFYSYDRTNDGRINGGFADAPGIYQPERLRPFPMKSWGRKLYFPAYRFGRRPTYDGMYRPVSKY